MCNLLVLCLALFFVGCSSNSPNQAGTPSAYDPYKSNRANQQQQQQQGGKHQQQQQHTQNSQQRLPNGQQQTVGYQQEQSLSQQQQQLPYSQAWPPSQIAQSAPPISGFGTESDANSWNDPRYFNPSHGANDHYPPQPSVSNSNSHNSNGFQVDDRDAYDVSYSLPGDVDSADDGFGAGDEDELYLGLERIVAEDGFPKGES